jgi:hypothetical protein
VIQTPLPHRHNDSRRPHYSSVGYDSTVVHTKCSADAAPTTEVEPSPRATRQQTRSPNALPPFGQVPTAAAQPPRPLRRAAPNEGHSSGLTNRRHRPLPRHPSSRAQHQGPQEGPYPLPLRAAAEQSDEPVEALRLKMSYDALGVINVRFAGYRSCSADMVHRRRGRGEEP